MYMVWIKEKFDCVKEVIFFTSLQSLNRNWFFCSLICLICDAVYGTEWYNTA